MIPSHNLYDKKFKNDEAYQTISRELVSMNKRHVKENNAILKQIILVKVVKLMREKDQDFDAMFEDLMYGGSFYKNLKVSVPDEYDLNLVVKLPIEYHYLKVEPDDAYPGYVKIQVLKTELSGNERFLEKISCGEYIDQNKFRSWIQSVLDRALTNYRANGAANEFVLKSRKRKPVYHLKYRQSGPAFTITVIKVNDQTEINFDLVPCLLFRDNRYLPGFRTHTEGEWMVIAKPLNHQGSEDYVRLLWRAAFYDDEKKLIAGHYKPIIRMIKKLRDIKRWHQLKSYFIETLFLHELVNQRFADKFKKASRTNLLMHMLRILQQKLASRVLTSFWHEGLNMLDDIPRLMEISSELQTIINRIDNNIQQDKNILLTIFELRP